MSVGMIIAGFILGIVILLILVTLHEFAHFVVAKICKAYVYEFSIGFGPRLLKWKRKETEYSIRLIPFGGYVYIASELTDPPKGREDEKFDESRYMEKIARWKRLFFIVSGAIFNLIIAIIIFTSMFAAIGYRPSDMTYYGANYNLKEAAYNSIYDAFGNTNHVVNQHDVIVGYTLWKLQTPPKTLQSTTAQPVYKPTTVLLWNRFDEQRLSANLQQLPDYTKTVYSFIDHLKGYNVSDQVTIYYAVVDKNQNITYNPGGVINPDADPQNIFNNVRGIFVGKTVALTGDTKKASVGIAAPNRIFKNSTEGYAYGWKETFEESKTILKSFGLLFTGQWAQLSGPVGIAKTMSDVVHNGGVPFFMYVGMLSANLFILNLIPIPPLDGYKFVETVVEMVIRKELSRKWKIIVNIAGAIVFIGLFVGITIKDIFF